MPPKWRGSIRPNPGPSSCTPSLLCPLHTGFLSPGRAFAWLSPPPRPLPGGSVCLAPSQQPGLLSSFTSLESLGPRRRHAALF